MEQGSSFQFLHSEPPGICPLQVKQRLIKSRKLKDLKTLRHLHHLSPVIGTSPRGTTASLTTTSTMTIKLTATPSHPAQGRGVPSSVPLVPPGADGGSVGPPGKSPCVGMSRSVPRAPEKV